MKFYKTADYFVNVNVCFVVDIKQGNFLLMFDFPQKTLVAWQRDCHFSRPLQKKIINTN